MARPHRCTTVSDFTPVPERENVQEYINFINRSVLLVALDQSIVSTALPRISSEFNALEELTWIVSTYFLTQAGLMLFFGQVLSKPMSKFLISAEMLILPNQPLSPLNGSSSFVSSSLRLDPSSVQSPRISMSSSLGVPSKVRPPYYPG
jgi:hypothetical protein